MRIFITYVEQVLEYFVILNNIDGMDSDYFVMVFKYDKIKPSVVLLCVCDKFILCK